MTHPLREKSYTFALAIIRICKLLDDKRAFTISRQLLGSGTSVGANVEEAQQAQSKPDFISKYSIALKEAVETEYWLRLIRDSGMVDIKQELFHAIIEIKRLLISSIKTTKSRI